MQWKDNVKARVIDEKQQNDYKDRSEEDIFQSQLEIFKFLKSGDSL